MNLPLIFDPGHSISVSAVRLADGAAFDFAAGAYLPPPAVPTTPCLALVEGTGIMAGSYTLSYPTSGAQWWDGDHLLTFHDLGPAAAAPGAAGSPHAVLQLKATFRSGAMLYAQPPFYSI
jgi:hypothetical protein